MFLNTINTFANLLPRGKVFSGIDITLKQVRNMKEKMFYKKWRGIKKLLTLILVVLGTTTGCSARTNVSAKKNDKMDVVDSIVVRAIGDSISFHINTAKNVEMRIMRQPQDSTVTCDNVKITGKHRKLLDFIVANPKNYMSDTIVYGKFLPLLSIEYYDKKTRITINYDFALRKWNFCDSEGKELYTFDIISDDIIRFAAMFFPENEYVRELINASYR